MSFHGSPDSGFGRDPQEWARKMTAKAEADRQARLAGYKSPFRRLLDRLRPHRQKQGDDPQSDHGPNGVVS